MIDDEEEALEHGVYHVKHVMISNGKRMTVESDFILRGDELLLVLEWVHRPEGDLWPKITLPLDEDLLDDDPERPGRFIYAGEIVDPRG